MTILIVEGPDGAGKSTLIRRLLEDYPDINLRDRACTSEDGPILDLAGWVDREDTLWSQVGDQARFLYDRHPLISEPIYGPLIRGKIADDIDGPGRQWFQHRWSMMMTRCKVVVCLPPLDDVIANVVESHQGDTEHLRGVLDNIPQIYFQYKTLVARDSRFMVWDYTQPYEPKQTVPFIANLFERRH